VRTVFTSALGSISAAVLASDFFIIENGNALTAAMPPTATPDRRKNVRRSMAALSMEPVDSADAWRSCFLISFIASSPADFSRWVLCVV
jgi:hypothetical protein